MPFRKGHASEVVKWPSQLSGSVSLDQKGIVDSRPLQDLPSLPTYPLWFPALTDKQNLLPTSPVTTARKRMAAQTAIWPSSRSNAIEKKSVSSHAQEQRGRWPRTVLSRSDEGRSWLGDHTSARHQESPSSSFLSLHSSVVGGDKPTFFDLVGLLIQVGPHPSLHSKRSDAIHGSKKSVEFLTPTCHHLKMKSEREEKGSLLGGRESEDEWMIHRALVFALKDSALQLHNRLWRTQPQGQVSFHSSINQTSATPSRRLIQSISPLKSKAYRKTFHLRQKIRESRQSVVRDL